MSDCHVANQIANYCNDSDSDCPDCSEELTLVYVAGVGEYLECEYCGWNNAEDE